MATYEADLARIEHSGPHPIDEEQREKNREAFALCADIMPIDDIHKLNDCDLVYRFLIAHRWNVKNAAVALHEYALFRKEQRLNEILWEAFPDEFSPMLANFQGFDREGHPVWYDRPDPNLLYTLITKFPRELLIRAHLSVMEQGRRLQRIYGVDRISCVMDLSNVTLGLVANPKAVGFMKEVSKLDQHMYPENMRTMLLLQSPWAFSGLWKVIRPLLDERVQKKINFINGGANMQRDIGKWVAAEQLLVQYGGLGDSEALNLLGEPLLDLPPGTPPQVKGGEAAAAGVFSPVEAPSSFAAGGADDSPNAAAAGDDATIAPDDFEFQSIPSSEDDSEVSPATSPSLMAASAAAATAGAPPPQRQQWPLPPPATPGQTAAAAVTATAAVPAAVEFVFRTQATGGRLAEGLTVATSEPICRSTGSAVLLAGTNALVAEIFVEAGHPVHAFVVVADAARKAHFIVKKRNFHRELHIFHPVGGKLTQRKNLQTVVDGERHHIYSVRPREGSNDLRDWQITVHGRRAEGAVGVKSGDVVRFTGALRHEGPVELLFALTAAIHELWYFSS